ncbi:hypothetical protein SPRG_15841 [Saprolegnia parasitica CBS 223.65]|uniref:Soluble calcium-activated nucleotidase 1 n=1 Tax=Saprolegnia parasitica (strain CBS 223.65) TaxID=695850 RepID=A0A067BK97_SAPPC|nr:hypothetical protein SPRG_15841 [Saprolegnia parasitica CBS 223.65]KDO18889.1 hypothetical protein SPRG_15841 [Saprolegnia parasitica CBS 223.65]|eukprot:XP_012210410.1 hypothetical protein SPRG_15841 [Saprolegnia parasitica CBS 223.65]
MGLCGSTLDETPAPQTKRETTFAMGLITDLDTRSKEVDDGTPAWHALFQRALLVRDADGRYSVEWCDAVTITTDVNEDGRGFELSELAWFEGRLLTFDDRTGMIFELTNFALNATGPLQATPLVAIKAGDGTVAKGAKNEWATVKGYVLYVGSHGVNWAPGGVLENDYHRWVAQLPSLDGPIAHVNWSARFDAVQAALGASGYVIHEAVEWSEHLQQWLLLPRRVSDEAFSDEVDATKGSNKLVLASEDFSDIEVRTVGVLVPERGYASFKFVPGTNDSVIAALKSVEDNVAGTQATYLSVIDVATGSVLLPDTEVPGRSKFEGLVFLQP